MNKKIINLVLFAIAVLLFTSCKKSDTQTRPASPKDSTAIMGFKDSTQLIKSIISYSMDSGSNVRKDSLKETYIYDTVNRKITVGFKDYNGATGIVSDSIVYHYNTANLLARVDDFLVTPVTDPTNIISEVYIYDAENIIQKAVFTEYSGQVFTYNINKTTLTGGGYQLGWLDTDPNFIADSSYYLASFNSQGQMVARYYDYYFDSVEYDVSGNTSKVIETVYQQPYYNPGVSETYTLYDFTSRDTKGDQLYNLNQVLSNGLSNINVDFGDLGGGLFESEYVFQFSKYPALSTNINRPGPNGYCFGCGVYQITSTSSPVYDNQNRLVRYKVFFNDDPLGYLEYDISYYK